MAGVPISPHLRYISKRSSKLPRLHRKSSHPTHIHILHIPQELGTLQSLSIERQHDSAKADLRRELHGKVTALPGVRTEVDALKTVSDENKVCFDTRAVADEERLVGTHHASGAPRHTDADGIKELQHGNELPVLPPPVGSLGVLLKPNDKGELEIVRLARGGSAEKSGKIQPGDIVFEVDHHDVYKKPGVFVQHIIQGPVGTNVEVKVYKNGDYNTPRAVRLERTLCWREVLAPAAAPAPVQRAEGDTCAICLENLETECVGGLGFVCVPRQVNADDESEWSGCCGTKICAACFTTYVTQQIQVSTELRCPGHCRRGLGDDEVRRHVDSAVMHRLDMKRAASARDHRPRPRPCSGWADARTQFVLRCTTVACPNCKTRVERNGGCDHMRCICGTHFAYCCGRRLDESYMNNHTCTAPSVVAAKAAKVTGCIVAAPVVFAVGAAAVGLAAVVSPVAYVCSTKFRAGCHWWLRR